MTRPDNSALDGRSPFFVPAFLDALGGLVHRNRNLWLWLGRLESLMLADKLLDVAIRKPIFICGLARSGSTLLHEIIASHPAVATHRIKDFPMVFTPFWWRRATVNLPPGPPHERVHQDGVMITTASPDALEEMIWMAFFPRCHDPTVSNLFKANARFPEFEQFYDLHLRKLLLAEKATRYAAKANYHIARLPYLARLFPDARFVIPVREPAAHVASLLRQHRWFCRGQHRNPRALAYMRRTGHFEFGLDRRPINLGDSARVRRVREAWATGDEIRGLAMSWDMVYSHLAKVLAANAQVRDAAVVVRFEALCTTPIETLHSVFTHCALTDAANAAAHHASSIRFSSYYDRELSPDDLAVIREETAATAAHWGYS